MTMNKNNTPQIDLDKIVDDLMFEAVQNREELEPWMKKRAEARNKIEAYIKQELERKNDPKAVSSLQKPTEHSVSKHIVPCDDCGSKDWIDWTLLPHELFNETCPGGNGYLCFDCFCKRRLEAYATARVIDKVESLQEYIKANPTLIDRIFENVLAELRGKQ